MTTRMPKIDNSTIHLNALFLQPTFKCGLNCQGCYVKGMEHNIDTSGLNIDSSMYAVTDTFIGLIHAFSGFNQRYDINGHPISTWANQITLAVDNLPWLTTASSPSNVYRTVMQDIFNSFVATAGLTKSRVDVLKENNAPLERPEFHITCNSPTALNQYLVGGLANDKSWHNIDVVTFSFLQASDVPLLKELKEAVPGIHINWNLTVFNESWLKTELAVIKEVAAVVDTIYYVLHKPALGDNLNIDSVKLYFNALPVIKNELGETFSKVNIDGCVTDARKFRDTGHGCSSNISRFQVWPNGSVSGCPYQQRPVTNGAEHLHGILENIREASKRYEFDDCRIPETLHPGSERGRARLGHRKPGGGRSLQVIN